jgi:DNA-binding MarR family transcriptional regulator
MSGAADGIGGERLVATDQLCQTFMRVFRMMKRSMTRATPPRPDGVEFAAYVLLAHLVVEGPMRSTALADAVHADPSTVSRQTAALVRHGMLERRADPIDGRASLLAATLDGQRAFDAYRQRNNGIIADVVRDWPVARIYQLASLLGDFAADFENHEYGQCPARPPAVAGPAPKGPRP